MVIEDMRHLEVLAGLAREIQSVINNYNALENGVTDKQKLVEMRIEQNIKLLDLLRQQRRALQFMAGEKIEPEMHFGEGVLIGTFGATS